MTMVCNVKYCEVMTTSTQISNEYMGSQAEVCSRVRVPAKTVSLLVLWEYKHSGAIKSMHPERQNNQAHEMPI
jgi:hypothetical protein